MVMVAMLLGGRSIGVCATHISLLEVQQEGGEGLIGIVPSSTVNDDNIRLLLGE
jgi:hypothetical protein